MRIDELSLEIVTNISQFTHPIDFYISFVVIFITWLNYVRRNLAVWLIYLSVIGCVMLCPWSILEIYFFYFHHAYKHHDVNICNVGRDFMISLVKQCHNFLVQCRIQFGLAIFERRKEMFWSRKIDCLKIYYVFVVTAFSSEDFSSDGKINQKLFSFSSFFFPFFFHINKKKTFLMLHYDELVEFELFDKLKKKNKLKIIKLLTLNVKHT